MLRPGHVLDAEDTREIIELAKKVCGIKDDPFERFRGDPAGLRKFLKAENRREREEIRTEERERSRKLRNLERRVKYAQRQVHAMIHPRPPRPEMDGPVIVVVDPR
ncbi:uncharacterized protein LAESUDRAFT_816661 [Laetiporus sulphureus 93-53]|uniref:Uncharacterized protein n=1 Tax=Laetiporus sulphureus 93-53 TaxID=1314785 RepID=A0A165B465_9APHY|nr:uncharacterized protein LAESUDRAFT_816661 [Laetiporus sulphureus 93-53]KZT00189.1 hypothetical protein LAESUDRAFT_816661 [Laetiporus sulphureus 93-53]